MKLCTVCGVVTSRTRSRRTDHARQSNRSRHNALYSTRAYAHGFALALPEKVVLARPTGVGRAISTCSLPIEGRDQWLAAARRLA